MGLQVRRARRAESPSVAILHLDRGGGAPKLRETEGSYSPRGLASSWDTVGIEILQGPRLPLLETVWYRVRSGSPRWAGFGTPACWTPWACVQRAHRQR